MKIAFQIDLIIIYHTLKELIKDKHLEIINIDFFTPDTVTKHFNCIRNADNRIENGDVLNPAIFCSDEHAKFFYTFDTEIIESKGISKYLNPLNKRIKEVA